MQYFLSLKLTSCLQSQGMSQGVFLLLALALPGVLLDQEGLKGPSKGGQEPAIRWLEGENKYLEGENNVDCVPTVISEVIVLA